jgi:hypothetical protein
MSAAGWRQTPIRRERPLKVISDSGILIAGVPPAQHARRRTDILVALDGAALVVVSASAIGVRPVVIALLCRSAPAASSSRLRLALRCR